jgi:hypothetical protein
LANEQAVRRNKPLSVFISLKAQRIYVRQGFDPLLEAAVTVNHPGRRFGTHVFTAMRYDDRNADHFEWRLVSAHLPAVTTAEADTGTRKKKQKDVEKVLPHTEDNSFELASDALDAISVPDDARYDHEPRQAGDVADRLGPRAASQRKRLRHRVRCADALIAKNQRSPTAFKR